MIQEILLIRHSEPVRLIKTPLASARPQCLAGGI